MKMPITLTKVTDLSGLKPQLRSTFRQVWSDERLKSSKQRIQVFSLAYLYITQSWEKIRLQLGGTSKGELIDANSHN